MNNLQALILSAILAFFSGSRVNHPPQNKISSNPITRVTISIGVPTPTYIPTSSITSEPPEEKLAPSHFESDPITICYAPSGSNCEGQSLKVRRSECHSKGLYSCCMINNEWILMSTDTCIIEQTILQKKISDIKRLMDKKEEIQVQARNAEAEAI